MSIPYECSVGGNFVIPSKSSIDYSSTEKWKVITSSEGYIWVYRTETADIWLSMPENQRGSEGNSRTFELENGNSITLKGAWHSNDLAFYKSTGIILFNKHVTWGCVGKGIRTNNQGQRVITDVIWADKSPVKGNFDRVDKFAKILAERYLKNEKIRLYIYSESSGGSSYGMVHLDDQILEKYGMLDEVKA